MADYRREGTSLRMGSSLRAKVVVITGASSGIARATAHAFSRQGYLVVLASRDEEALQVVAEECKTVGGVPLVVPTDVSNPADVFALQSRAIESFGKIDVWINCAAVLMFGKIEAQPLRPFRRVIETNLYGYLYGTRAAIEVFQGQESGGVLINVGSLLGLGAEPYLSAYVTSKAAIRALTACVRQEMRCYPNIHVCSVLPVAIDTPIYQKAANYYGKIARSLAPVYDVEKVSHAIAKLAQHPRAEIVVGAYGHPLSLLLRAFPRLGEALIGRVAPRLQFESDPLPEHDGNLFESKLPQRKDGNWRRYWRKAVFRRSKR
jgi:NAD(P)-dependent dehydrogenase (short-subunit alcohol dehydrogenase family)